MPIHTFETITEGLARACGDVNMKLTQFAPTSACTAADAAHDVEHGSSCTPGLAWSSAEGCCIAETSPR